MPQLGQPVAFRGEPFFRGEKKLLEVVLLPAVGDVNNLFRAEVFDAVEHRGEVRRGVVRRPVALAHDERLRGEALVLLVEHHERALVFLGDAGLGQLFVNPADFVAVERLAERHVDGDVHSAVHSLERRGAYLVYRVPERDVFGVAVLELDELRARGVGVGGRFLREGAAALIHLLELFEGVFVGGVGAVVFGFDAVD